MKLRELLHEMTEVQNKIGVSEPFVCGGVPRDRYMGRLDNIADLDITTGDRTVDYLSQEFYLELRKKYNVTRTTATDGHSTIHLGAFKMDFSSNFNVPNIESILVKKGIVRPTDMQKEIFSRDMTCNALLLDFDLKNVIDPTHRGFKDIKDKKINTCLSPDITLTSNKNRVIRAVYLACKLDFNVDKSIIDFVKQNPQTAKISTPKVMKEKIDQAFIKDSDRASYLITQMGLWNYIPISESIYPYYVKHNKSAILANKKAYFQGGGGVNEPTPGTPKYKAEKAITIQPRFVEPFYRNYDLYLAEGVNGPPVHTPGVGWHHMHEYKSIQEYLEQTRKFLRGKYVAEDTYITEQNHKEREDKMKLRADMINIIVKTASGDHFKTMCNNCGAIAAQCRCPGYFHKNEPQKIAYVDSCSACKKTANDDNDGSNFDYGKGLYQNMDKYKSVKDFEEHADKGPGAFFADDNDDYMLPPKEHGTKIYDWKNSPYQGKPKAPKRHHDKNDLDFPIDDQVTPIIGDSESYNSPIQMGPSAPDDMTISPNQDNLGNYESYPAGAQLGGYLDKYLSQPDPDDKPESTLDFGYDLTTNENPSNSLDEEDLEKLVNKYLNPTPTHGLYGLPDGVDLPDEDLGDPTDLNPDYGTYGPESKMYEDKWNI